MYRRVLLLAVGGAAAAFAAIAVLDSGGLTVATSDAAGMTILLGAGGSASLVGTLLARPGDAGRVGLLLGISGIVWLLGVCATPGAPSPLVFTVGSIAASGVVVVVAHLAFVAPTGTDRVGRLVGATLAAGYGVTFLLVGVGGMLFFEPRLHGCRDCPANLLLLRDDPTLAAVLTVAGAWVALGWTALAGGLLLLRIMRSARGGASVAMLVSIFALVFLLGATRPLLSDIGLGPALVGWGRRSMFWAIEGGALTAIALTLAFARMTARRRVHALAHLLLDRRGAEPGNMTLTLRTALADPLLEIRYPSGEGGYVTNEGEPADVARDRTRSSTPLGSAAAESALVVHRPALFDSPGLREDVGSTARLGLAHERLLAVRRAQLRALEASHDRLVAAAAAERRRLARDLHDGAQQQLVGLALLLRFARSQIDEHAASGSTAAVADHLAEAQQGVDESLRSLRSLTRGLQSEHEAPREIELSWRLTPERSASYPL